MEFLPGQRVQIVDTHLPTRSEEVTEVVLVGFRGGCGYLVRPVFDVPFHRRFGFDRFDDDLESNPGWRTAVFSDDGYEKSEDLTVVRTKETRGLSDRRRPPPPKIDPVI